MTNEADTRGGLSRRRLLHAGLGLGLGAGALAVIGAVLDFLWMRDTEERFGGVINVGPAPGYPPGSKTLVHRGRFWLVSLTEAEGGPGLLALRNKCTHLGCEVPWNADLEFPDPATGITQKGWFRCPCHDATFDAAGVRVYGPSPRGMDRMKLEIVGPYRDVKVDTGRIIKATPDNAKFAVKTDV